MLTKVLDELGELLNVIKDDAGATLATKDFEVAKIKDMTAAFKAYLNDLDFDEFEDERIAI